MTNERLFSRWGLSMLVVGIAAGTFLGATLWPKKEVVVRQGTPETPAAITSVNLMVNYGNGKTRTWNTVSHHEAMSVLNLLEEVAGTKNIVLQTGMDGNGKPVVVSIDGVTNDDKAGLAWHYWVNNVYEPRPANKYYLKPGDIIVWSYGKGEAQ
jgi:hypothetical protein